MPRPEPSDLPVVSRLPQRPGPSAHRTDGSSALASPAAVYAPPGPGLRIVRPVAMPNEIPPTSLDAVPAPPVRLLLRGLLEVLSGWRPASQMVLHASPEIAADLLARPRRRKPTPPARVERLRVIRVADDAVEACVVLRRGHRCGALAMRLEFGSRGWLVTRLQVG